MAWVMKFSNKTIFGAENVLQSQILKILVWCQVKNIRHLLVNWNHAIVITQCYNTFTFSCSWAESVISQLFMSNINESNWEADMRKWFTPSILNPYLQNHGKLLISKYFCSFRINICKFWFIHYFIPTLCKWKCLNLPVFTEKSG